MIGDEKRFISKTELFKGKISPKGIEIKEVIRGQNSRVGDMAHRNLLSEKVLRDDFMLTANWSHPISNGPYLRYAYTEKKRDQKLRY